MKKLWIKPVLEIGPESMKNLVTFGVTSSGILYWLEQKGDTDIVEKVNGAAFPKVFPNKATHYSIKYFVDNHTHSIELENQEMNFHLLCPLNFPETWIVANARSNYHKEESFGDKNVRIVDFSGENTERILLW